MNPGIPVDSNPCVFWPPNLSWHSPMLSDHRGTILCDGVMHHRIQANEDTGKPEQWVVGWCPKSVEGGLVKRMTEDLQTFDNFDPKHQQKSFNYMKEWCGKFNSKSSTNVILSGSYGTGKTHLAKASLYALRHKGFFVIFVQADRMLEMFLASSPTTEYGDDHKDALRLVSDLERADLVIMDDLGSQTTKTESDYFKDRFRALMDRMRGRYIITTNSDKTQLRERLGDAIMSRLLENSMVLTMTGSDYRQKKTK